jgi:hypothetical protein
MTEVTVNIFTEDREDPLGLGPQGSLYRGIDLKFGKIHRFKQHNSHTHRHETDLELAKSRFTSDFAKLKIGIVIASAIGVSQAHQ